jgi:hypothetical protein
MDEKTRLKRFGIGAVATLVVTIAAGLWFGSIAVPLTLAIGLGATLLFGGGRAKG